jgi:Putative phage serine protease XkdF
MLSFSDIIKDSPTVSDVHTTASLGSSRRRRGQLPISVIDTQQLPSTSATTKSFSIVVPITKIDEELRTVYGWASVNTEKGLVVTDHQDDQVSDAEIVKAAHDFISNSRTGGLLHARTDEGTAHRGGDIVESLVMTPDVQKALGVDLGKTGWFIGYRVNDADAWSLVKSGVLKAFSIGGKAKRVPV